MGISRKKNNQNQVIDKYYYPLPSKFIVNSSYLIPPSNQFNRGTCWIFSSIGLLESYYRHQGIQSGYLMDDEYLSLSQEAAGNTMINICKENPNSESCSGGRKEHKTSSGSFDEFFKFSQSFPEFRSSILPESSCPYQNVTNETAIECPNSTIDIKNNPLKFNINKNATIVTGIDNIKELLYNSKKPLLHAFPNPVNRYWFECDNEIVQDSEMCKNELYQCPVQTNKYCAPIEYHLSKPHTTELIFHRSKDITVGVSHATLLVGYNDDFVEPIPVEFTQRPIQKGGFIIKNSWGNHGHSLEYLSGQITKEQEDSICPNPDDVYGWIPATYSCMKERFNPSKCSLDLHRQFGSKVQYGASSLICVNETHCNVNKKYVLLRDELSGETKVDFTPDGVPLANVIEYDDDNVQKAKVDTLPYNHLYYAFKLENPPDSNSRDHCGYYFFFYDTITEISSQLYSETGVYRAINIDIEWTKESYERSGSNKNYTRVHESIHKFKPYLPISSSDEPVIKT